MRALRTTLAAAAAAGMLVWAGSFDDRTFAQPRPSDKKVCAVDHVSPMGFGSYDPMSDSALDLLGQISYRCYNKSFLADPATPDPDFSPIAVEISISQGGSNSFLRRMTGGRDQLDYNLYLDALHLIIWGDGTSGTSTYRDRALPNNHMITVPVFGRIPGGQDVTWGQYIDNVVVTLNF